MQYYVEVSNHNNAILQTKQTILPHSFYYLVSTVERVVPYMMPILISLKLVYEYYIKKFNFNFIFICFKLVHCTNLLTHKVLHKVLIYTFFNVCILRLLYIKVTLFTTVYFLLIINHSEAILCGLLDK